VVKQAQAIGARRFITIPEPRTQEFRRVVRAMNALSGQVRSMLEEESAQLEKLRRDAQYDALTGLMNREHFMKSLQLALSDEQSAPVGTLFILRLSDLIGMNKTLGREATDSLLKRVAAALLAYCPDPACLVGRLNGSDFALLVPNVESDARQHTQQLFARVQLSINDPSTATQHVLLLGAAVYHHGDPLSQVLSRADLALSLAPPEGGSAVEEGDVRIEWKPASSLLASWRALIESALEQKQVQFATYPALSGQGELIHFEAPARMQNMESAAWMSAQEFMPWVSRLGLIERIDAVIFERALDWLQTNEGAICLNMSGQSVCDPQQVAHLARSLKNRLPLAQRLWIDIPEFVAYRHAAEFRVFCNTLKPLGCKIGLEHVGNQIGRMGELYDVGLDYLKIDSAIIRDIDQSMGNQTFLRGLCTIAHAMGMITIAEGVLNQQEADCLKSLGFNGMTGPGIRLGQETP